MCFKTCTVAAWFRQPKCARGWCHTYHVMSCLWVHPSLAFITSTSSSLPVTSSCDQLLVKPEIDILKPYKAPSCTQPDGSQADLSSAVSSYAGMSGQAVCKQHDILYWYQLAVGQLCFTLIDTPWLDTNTDYFWTWSKTQGLWAHFPTIPQYVFHMDHINMREINKTNIVMKVSQYVFMCVIHILLYICWSVSSICMSDITRATKMRHFWTIEI